MAVRQVVPGATSLITVKERRDIKIQTTMAAIGFPSLQRTHAYFLQHAHKCIYEDRIETTVFSVFFSQQVCEQLTLLALDESQVMT